MADRFRGNVTVSVVPQGHAAGGAALQQAVHRLATAQSRWAAIVGVDSYISAETIAWLDRLRQLHATYNAWGFIPGEAAGACVIATVPSARSRASRPLALIEGLGLEQEEVPIKTDGVCLGWGLTRAVRSALADLEPEEAVDRIYCDQNGETYRADELGFMLARLGERFRNPADFVAPADCWGDVGAATVPLLIALVAAAAERGYARRPAQPGDRRLEVRAAAAASSCARGTPEPWPSPFTSTAPRTPWRTRARSGIAKSTLPDVCKTPSPGGPVPVPYPIIISMTSDLTGGTTTVKVDGGNMAAVKGSKLSRCSGDEPGTAGGLKSSTNMKEAAWILYSFDVKLDGKNACRLTDKLQMNHGNTACLAGLVQLPVVKGMAAPATCQYCKRTREEEGTESYEEFYTDAERADFDAIRADHPGAAAILPPPGARYRAVADASARQAARKTFKKALAKSTGVAAPGQSLDHPHPLSHGGCPIHQQLATLDTTPGSDDMLADAAKNEGLGRRQQTLGHNLMDTPEDCRPEYVGPDWTMPPQGYHFLRPPPGGPTTGEPATTSGEWSRLLGVFHHAREGRFDQVLPLPDLIRNSTDRHLRLAAIRLLGRRLPAWRVRRGRGVLTDPDESIRLASYSAAACTGSLESARLLTRHGSALRRGIERDLLADSLAEMLDDEGSDRLLEPAEYAPFASAVAERISRSRVRSTATQRSFSDAPWTCVHSCIASCTWRAWMIRTNTSI